MPHLSTIVCTILKSPIILPIILHEPHNNPRLLASHKFVQAHPSKPIWSHLIAAATNNGSRLSPAYAIAVSSVQRLRKSFPSKNTAKDFPAPPSVVGLVVWVVSTHRNDISHRTLWDVMEEDIFMLRVVPGLTWDWNVQLMRKVT